ncbi:Cys-tRNA(Pro) deacylase [Glaciecola sp. MF2-115]|uniref:Cys-tRNA(Pro) deacylase n=1 Tax=Glaciecola sp. MF2-115 TaxID=3384827 RepID=UPI0039A0A904
MTPAILFLEKQKVEFELLEYEHDASNQNFANEAAEKLGLKAESVFKTLVVEVDSDKFVVAIVPSNKQLSMKKLAKAVSGKKAILAQAKKVQNMTGYVLGGVSPFGQKKRLVTILDVSANNFESIFVSGGRRGLELSINPAVFPEYLNARISDIAT